MRRCNAYGCEIKGENVCCKDCESLQTCEVACEDALDQTKPCPEEQEEETALQVFQREQAIVIKNMADLLKQKKALEETEKTVRAKLVEAMNAYGVKSFECDLLKVTYVAATSKTAIDSNLLKKEKPDIYEQYSKTSPVSASVRIALK